MINIHNERPVIFIGYDSAQDFAFKLCEKSILDHAQGKVDIYPINHKILREIGLFNRPWLTNEEGQRVDIRDGKPFSTEFSHTRFLVPAYSHWLGLLNQYVLFIDSDFLFLDDIFQLYRCVDKEPGKSIYVVKHDYTPKGSVKMDKQDQAVYNKKLWSSLMLFNLNQVDLSANLVNSMTGRELHQFDWLQSDDSIGSVEERWNFIPNHSEPRVSDMEIGAIHFTEGTPLHEGYENCKYSGQFKKIARTVDVI